jgi:hypothetical protein
MNTRTSKTSSNKNNSAKSNAKNTSTPSSPKSTKSSSPRMHPKKIDDVNKLQATPRKQARSSRDQSPVKRLDKR